MRTLRRQLRISSEAVLPRYHVHALSSFRSSPLPRSTIHNTVMPPGDIFVYGGDILFVSRWYHESTKARKMKDFNDWLGTHVNCPVVVCIGGNHDDFLESLGKDRVKSVLSNVTHYIENNEVTVGNLRFFGSPASEGRSHNRAFQSEDFRKAAQEASKALHAEVRRGGEPIDVFLSHGPEVSAPSWFHLEFTLRARFPLAETPALRNANPTHHPSFLLFSHSSRLPCSSPTSPGQNRGFARAARAPLGACTPAIWCNTPRDQEHER